MRVENATSISRACAGHVDFSEGALVVAEFPFAKETEGAHAKGEDRRGLGVGSEERGGVENCAIAAEGGCYVDFLVEEVV